jgi:subtilisin-like proprotein convertase family protein
MCPERRPALKQPVLTAQRRCLALLLVLAVVLLAQPVAAQPDPLDPFPEAPTRDPGTGEPTFGTQSYSISSPITIPSVGNGSPFPSQVNFPGGGVITDVNVTLNGLTHPYPDDVDIFLQSPTGQRVMIMSDACGGNPVSGLSLTFSDEAINLLPNNGPCGSGEYRPANFLGESAENFGTGGPYFATLSAFDGYAASGTWRLYVRDDAAGPGSTVGAISSWTLTISTQASFPNNLVTNGTFSNGIANWTPYGNIVWNLSANPESAFQFYRTGASALVFQNTGAALPANGSVWAQVYVGNSSGVRKRVSILLHNANWSDSQFCGFWIPPNTPLRPYTIRTHTNQAWSNAAISIYAATADTNPWLRVDNVRMESWPFANFNETLCIDPAPPQTTQFGTSGNLLTNPNFDTGGNPPPGWLNFGTITQQWVGGVVEFRRYAGTPSGVFYQNTGTNLGANVQLEARFQLGNNSPTTRQRAVILLHRPDFTDSLACAFWLPPNSPLQTYLIRTFTTRDWAGSSISFYPSYAVSDGFIRLDQVLYRVRYDLNVNGTECYPPGSLVDNSTEWELAEAERMEMERAETFLSQMQPTLEPTATPALPSGELPIIATPGPFEGQSPAEAGEGQLSE